MRVAVKLQSAMEYLMTYGWAILIIAIVLIALFSLGVFSSNNLGTSCIAESGFECSNLTLVNILPAGADTNTIAILRFNLGQATGSAIYNALIIISPENTTIIPFFSTHIPWPMSAQIGSAYAGTVPTFQSGATNSVTIEMGGGYIWYQSNSNLQSQGGLQSVYNLGSNSIGHVFNGYAWIGYNSTSPSGKKMMVQRVARITVPIT